MNENTIRALARMLMSGARDDAAFNNRGADIYDQNARVLIDSARQGADDELDAFQRYLAHAGAPSDIDSAAELRGALSTFADELTTAHAEMQYFSVHE